MKEIFIFLIRVYQRAISPLFPPVCRYYPSCSEYTAQSLKKFGVFKGGIFSLKRILRCHPFSKGGYDPPPEIM